MTPDGMVALLPDGVEVMQANVDVPQSVLLPEEATVIARAAPNRRAEFATVRHCAREVLARLGHPPAPLLPGPDREPQWPSGVVGSLTHCDGYRAAAAAHTAQIASIGIDAETHEPLPEGVTPLVTVGNEPHMLAELSAAHPQIAWDRVLFSAKESIYKTWFPLARKWLDFTECELTLRLDNGSFSGRILVPGPVLGARRLQHITGRWEIHDSYILTAAHHPAR